MSPAEDVTSRLAMAVAVAVAWGRRYGRFTQAMPVR